MDIEQEGSALPKDPDADRPGIGMFLNIGEDFLEYPVNGNLGGGRQEPVYLLNFHAHLRTSLAGMVIDKEFQGIGQPQVFYENRGQTVGELANMIDNLVDVGDSLIKCFGQSDLIRRNHVFYGLDTQLQHGQALPQIVMEIRGNPFTLSLLSADQVRMERLETSHGAIPLGN